MNKKTYHDILDSAASDSLSHNPSLWPNISARLERKSLMQNMRTRPLLMVVIAMLALFLITGVVYALGRSLGYIPGIGIVDQSVPIRILAEPVSLKDQGISVTVSKMVADSTRVFISYRVDGIPLVKKGVPACATMPEMYLPDGGKLETISFGDGIPVMRSGDSMYYEAEYVYSRIPAGINKVTFVLSCILPKETEPRIGRSYYLISAPPNFVTPAIEIGATYSSSGLKHATTPTSTRETATPRVIETSSQLTPTHVLKGSGLSLEKVLELTDSYILIGKFTDAGDLPEPLDIWTSSDSDYLPHIEDANGIPVSFKVRTDVRPDPDWGKAYYWAYEIQKPVTTPLKIIVDRVDIRKHSTALLQFDTGAHPQVKQEWKLNQPVKLGASTFVVDSVVFFQNGYRFNLSTENLPEGVTPDIEILDSSLRPYQFDNISSTEDHIGNKALYTIRYYKNPPPSGNLSVNWGLDESIPLSGPWSLIWTPSTTNP